MQRFVTFLLLLGCLLPAAHAAQKNSRWHAVWRVSQVLLAGANSADITSSWGKNEANPILRTGQQFGYGSLAIKLGVLAGGLAAQHYLVRKSPEQARWLSFANLGATAGLSAVTVHNMHVQR